MEEIDHLPLQSILLFQAIESDLFLLILRNGGGCINPWTLWFSSTIRTGKFEAWVSSKTLNLARLGSCPDIDGSIVLDEPHRSPNRVSILSIRLQNDVLGSREIREACSTTFDLLSTQRSHVFASFSKGLLTFFLEASLGPLFGNVSFAS